MVLAMGGHAVGGLRGNGPSLAGKLGGGSAIALRAGMGLIASSACFGPIPLPHWWGGCLRRSWWGSAGLMPLAPGWVYNPMQMWLGRRRFRVQPWQRFP